MIIYIFHNILKFKVMHFTFFVSLFLTKEMFFPFSDYGIYLLDSKQNVGAGKNTLSSISDGIEPSIFYRKMQNARPMREEKAGKVIFFSATVGIFWL